jgi:hypothetical protein
MDDNAPDFPIRVMLRSDGWHAEMGLIRLLGSPYSTLEELATGIVKTIEATTTDSRVLCPTTGTRTS